MATWCCCMAASIKSKPVLMMAGNMASSIDHPFGTKWTKLFRNSLWSLCICLSCWIVPQHGYFFRYFFSNGMKSSRRSCGGVPAGLANQVSFALADLSFRTLVPLVSLIAQTSAPCRPLWAAMIIHFQLDGCSRKLGATRASRSVEAKTSSYWSNRTHPSVIGFPSLHVLGGKPIEFLSRCADRPCLARWRQIACQHFSVPVGVERISVTRDRIGQIGFGGIAFVKIREGSLDHDEAAIEAQIQVARKGGGKVLVTVLELFWSSLRLDLCVCSS